MQMGKNLFILKFDEQTHKIHCSLQISTHKYTHTLSKTKFHKNLKIIEFSRNTVLFCFFLELNESKYCFWPHRSIHFFFKPGSFMGWKVFPSFTVCDFLSPLIIRFDYKNSILDEQQYKIRLTSLDTNTIRTLS